SQAITSARDLAGLCLFDHNRVVTYVRPARGSRHLVELLNVLADAAGLAPATGTAEVATLLPLAHGLAEEVYPHLLRPDINHVPIWLPWLIPQPGSALRRPGVAARSYGWLGWLLLLGGAAGIIFSVVAGFWIMEFLAGRNSPGWPAWALVGLGWLVAAAL